MKKKKILYIHHGNGIGGAPLSLLYLIQKIDLDKYKPKVIFFYNDKMVKLYQKNGIECRVIIDKKFGFYNHTELGWIRWYRPDKLIKFFLKWPISTFLLAKPVLKEEKPDIVHLNSVTISDWALAAKLLNIKVVCHVREPIVNGYFGFRKKILRKILNYSVDRFIVISKDNAKKLNIPLKTDVIYNTVDFNYFNKNVVPKFNPEESKYVLYLGGNIPIKGFEVMVNSLKFLSEDITVIFAGNYDYSNESEKENNQNSLKIMRNSKNAKEIGICYDIPSLIASSQLVVIPSTVPHFARPVIEAGAMAKPVVASDVDGMNEIVIDGKSGLLFRVNEPKSLAKQINKICCNRELAIKMGEFALKNARNLFDAEFNSKRVFKIYDELSANR